MLIWVVSGVGARLPTPAVEVPLDFQIEVSEVLECRDQRGPALLQRLSGLLL